MNLRNGDRNLKCSLSGLECDRHQKCGHWSGSRTYKMQLKGSLILHNAIGLSKRISSIFAEYSIEMK